MNLWTLLKLGVMPPPFFYIESYNSDFTPFIYFRSGTTSLMGLERNKYYGYR